MGLYMIQFSYTPEAWGTLAKNPQDWSEPVRMLLEKLGGRLIELYYSFGEYDGVVIGELPDDIAAAATSIAAVTPGHIKAIKTTKLLSRQEILDVMRRAGEVAYPGPKSA